MKKILFPLAFLVGFTTIQAQIEICSSPDFGEIGWLSFTFYDDNFGITDHQQGDKASVNYYGNYNNDGDVHVVVTGKNGVIHIQTLQNNEIFEFAYDSGAGGDGNNITFSIYADSSDTQIVEESSYHLSCSAPIHIGDQLGAITLTTVEDIEGNVITNSPLSVDPNALLENVSIYNLDKATLRVTGLQNSKTDVKILNILGKQVLKTSFQSNGVSDIYLPQLVAGVYVIILQTDKGMLSKKIILH